MTRSRILGRTLLATMATASLACPADADFVGPSVTSLGELIPGTVTYRISVEFDDPGDALLAISASETPLRWSGAMLVQNEFAIEPTTVWDVPQRFSGVGDSWVTIGGDLDAMVSDTQFSPGFLNPDVPGLSVVRGSFFEQLENGGYFDLDPGTRENGGSVVIAQFTIAAGAAGLYEGTANWQADGAVGYASDVFAVVVPAPAAMATLGIAGLVRARRRTA